MKLNLSIRTKLLFIVLFILLPLTVLQHYSGKREYQRSVQIEIKNCEDISEAISASFTNFIEEVWLQEDAISSFIILHQEMNVQDIQSYFEIVGKKQQILSRFSWVDADGTVLASSTHELIGKNLTDREYVKEIIEGKDETVSSMIESRADGKYVIPIAKAVRKDGRLIGIITAPIDVEKLDMRLPSSFRSFGKVLSLFDNYGKLVYKSDLDINSEEVNVISEDNTVKKALNGETVTHIRKSGSDNKMLITIDYPMKAIGWVCSLSIPYDSVMAKHYHNLKMQNFLSAIILIIVALFAVGLVLMFSYRIINPLTELKNAVNKIQNGDYSVRTNIHGFNEVVEMSREFNKMVGAIEEHDNIKSQFYVDLSHELKTPLNVIYASSQLVQTLNKDVGIETYHYKVKKQMKIISQNCYRLIRMINNLLDITRLENKYLPIRFGNYNIINIIEEITISVVEFASSKNIDIIFDTEVEEKIMVFDPDKIERIMLNLISNALKFTKPGGRILVNIYDNSDNIIISVRDTGIGIPEDKLNLIFERFMQVDTTMAKNHEGSGIGLSLVKALVEAHEGTISVRSKLGEGSEFIIKLPVRVLPQTDTCENEEVIRDNLDKSMEKVNIELSDIYI